MAQAVLQFSVAQAGPSISVFPQGWDYRFPLPLLAVVCVVSFCFGFLRNWEWSPGCLGSVFLLS